jgi:glycosyltransferase involved in cell wall biosynthesis
MQGLIDLVSRANPPWPLVFKQHPADLLRKNRHLRLQCRRPQDLLYPHEHGNVHQILASGRCLGIVSVNSNVVHDGLLWDVPAVALGRGVWPRSGPGPFLDALPSDWEDLAHHLEAPEVVRIREAYAAHLVRHQWTLDALGERDKVHDLLVRVASRGLVTLPKKSRALPTIHRPLRINVVARDCGWLFEDLKRHFVAASDRNFLVTASERPQRNADRWIFLRTHEATASPNAARTVVQIHDLFDDGLYRPGGFRSGAVRRSGAIVLTHPRQREILSDSGISLEGKTVVCRPLGALSAFSVRQTFPEVFSVGWVGRPVFRRKRDVKRVDWLVDALRRLRTDRTPTRVLLVGERLGDAARALTDAGIECSYHHRRTTPIEQYPGLYHQLDVLVVTSRLAAGPNSLFEALASGVPVISTRTGWAPMLVKPAENGDLVDSVDELVDALRSTCTERETWFDRRDAIRRSLGEATVESWVEENLAAAAALSVGPRSLGFRSKVAAGDAGAVNTPAP